MRLRLDFAAQLVGQKDAELLSEAGLRLAAARLNKLLLELDPAELKPAILKLPTAYPRLLGILCKITDGLLKHHRLRQGF